MYLLYLCMVFILIIYILIKYLIKIVRLYLLLIK